MGLSNALGLRNPPDFGGERRQKSELVSDLEAVWAEVDPAVQRALGVQSFEEFMTLCAIRAEADRDCDGLASFGISDLAEKFGLSHPMTADVMGRLLQSGSVVERSTLGGRNGYAAVSPNSSTVHPALEKGAQAFRSAVQRVAQRRKALRETEAQRGQRRAREIAAAISAAPDDQVVEAIQAVSERHKAENAALATSEDREVDAETRRATERFKFSQGMRR